MADVVDWATGAERLSRDEVGVLPTDTLYGIVGSAMKPTVVERIYDMRKREREKPMIVLIGDWADLPKLKVGITSPLLELLKKVWPGPVSVVMPVAAPELEYLHRGTNSIAIRMPDKPELRALLTKVGPLVAPSANLARQTPALTIQSAQSYFGDSAFYIDEGELDNPPSALVDARFNPPRVLRPAPGFKLN